MYHISNDKRAKNSAKRIGDGLLICLKNKKIGEVTVSDVQRAAMVGRSTFYRLFDNVDDVLSYLCDNVFESAYGKFEDTALFTPERTTLEFIRTWMDNEALLTAIVDCNRTDFIFRSHEKYLMKERGLFFKEVSTDEVQLTYLTTIMTACTAAILTAWLLNGKKESAEQIQARIKKCFKTLGSIFD